MTDKEKADIVINLLNTTHKDLSPVGRQNLIRTALDLVGGQSLVDVVLPLSTETK